MKPAPSPSDAKTSQGRTHEIDGLRGWAALNVVLFHIFGECLQAKLPELNASWLSVFLDGHYAVLLFFIISGDALSQPFLKTGTREKIDLLAIKRYSRLTVPVLLSCAIVYLLIAFKLDFHIESSQVLQRQNWLGRFLQIEATPYEFFRYAFWGVYSNHTPSNSYNPFLWTMGIELTGSYIVFMLCYTRHHFRSPNTILVAIGLFFYLMASSYFFFIFGMLLSILRKEGFIAKYRTNSVVQITTMTAILAAVIFVHETNRIALPTVVKFAFAATLATAIYFNSFCTMLLSTRPSQFLGKISFPIYLLHFPLIISLLSYLSIQAEHAEPNSRAAYITIGLATLFSTIALSIPFLKLEEFILARVNQLIDRQLVGKK